MSMLRFGTNCGYRVKVWDDKEFLVVDNFYRIEQMDLARRDFDDFVADIENKEETKSHYTEVKLLTVTEIVEETYPRAKFIPKVVRVP